MPADEQSIGNAGSLKVITDNTDGKEYLYYLSVLDATNYIQWINIETGITERVAGIAFDFDAVLMKLSIMELLLPILMLIIILQKQIRKTIVVNMELI